MFKPCMFFGDTEPDKNASCRSRKSGNLFYCERVLVSSLAPGRQMLD